MKVNSVQFTQLDNVYKTKNIQKISTKKKSDSIQISNLGKYLNEVTNNKDEINVDKINDIKRRIEKGTYSVDSKTLAKKIIERMEGNNN